MWPSTGIFSSSRISLAERSRLSSASRRNAARMPSVRPRMRPSSVSRTGRGEIGPADGTAVPVTFDGDTNRESVSSLTSCAWYWTCVSLSVRELPRRLSDAFSSRRAVR
jgi:hypothetical protein